MSDIDGDGSQSDRDIDQLAIAYVSVPTSGPEFEAALKNIADKHKASLPFFVSEAQAVAMARPLIADFFAQFAGESGGIVGPLKG